MGKPIINGIIIVEGKTDSSYLKSFLDCKTYETNGSDLSVDKINTIKELAKTNNIILFLDPDMPGEKIRKKLQDNLDHFYQCFISKKDIDANSKKIGVAEASKASILNALKNYIVCDKTSNTLSLNDYDKLKLNSKQKRLSLCSYLKISYCNNKQLFKRLNLMHLTYDELRTIIYEKLNFK